MNRPLKDMIDDFLDGALSDDDRDLFNAALDDDRAMRDFIFANHLHALIYDAMSESAPLAKIEDADTEPQVIVKRASMFGVRFWGLALAAAVTLAATVWFAMSPGPSNAVSRSTPPAGLAILTNLEDAVFDESGDANGVESPKLGHELSHGPIRLVSGKAQVMFNSTAVVDLAGPCEFRMVGPNRGRLTSGRVEAYVPERAHGFVVELAGDARIVDLGTRFVADVSNDGVSMLHVTEGKVRLETRDNQYVLAAGDVRQISAGVARNFSDDVLLMNPVAYWRFDAAEDGRAIDLIGLRRASFNGTAHIADPDDDRSLVLDGRGYLTLDADDALNQIGNRLTVAAWVRLNSRERQAIVHKCYDVASYSLEIFDEHPAFVVMQKGQHKPIHVGASELMPVDRWVFLAGVYDGRTVALYVDGRRVAEESASRSLPVNVSRGPIYVGRRSDRDADYVDGRISRLAIFDAALSPEQIATLSKQTLEPTEAPTKFDAGK